MKLRNTLLFLALGISSITSYANDDSGLTVGGGIFGASSSGCDFSGCNYSGQYAEVGYDVNELLSVEFKYGVGDSSYSFGDTDLSVSYLGANVGSNFDTTWFHLYGKLGIATITEDASYYYSEYTETSPTIGIGARFFFSDKTKGLYATIESLAVSFQNDSIGYAYLAGVGYKF